MNLQMRAPVRIDLAGAWTDVAYFAEPFGGATLNIAITNYVTGSVEVGGHAAESCATSSFRGIKVHYETEIPAGSGLGTSGALNVLWAALAQGKLPRTLDERIQLAQQAYDIEQALGIIGGKQDQCAAAIGGCTRFEFKNGAIEAFPISVKPEILRNLEGCLTLIYTGAARLSSNLHEHVWGRFRAGVPEVTDALIELKDSVPPAVELLTSGDLERLGQLISRQHELARALDPSTDPDIVRKVRTLVAATTSGSKCCGAGGGGCVLFLSPDPAATKQTRTILREHNFEIIPCTFDFEGIREA